MKELNEYRDEIFRRSEKKKRQIKKRRRIALGVGIPLCLCCVMTLAIIPYLHLGMKGDFAPNMEAVYDGIVYEKNEMQEMPMQAFRVTDPTDAARVLAILEGTAQESTADKQELGKDQFLADQTEPDEYRLTLCCSDGSTLHYRVRGQEVYSEIPGKSYWLSAAEARSLYTLLTEVAEHE